MAITEKDVLTILRTEQQPLKARRIAYMLRTESGKEVTRTEVNRLLYAMQSRGLVATDQSHVWKLIGEAKYGVNDTGPADKT